MRAVSKILLILLACVRLAAGQAAPISGQAVSQYGTPLPYASVRVCSVTATIGPDGFCTPTASIYLDYNLTVPAGNPYTADEFGNYSVYAPALAAPNLYIVQLFPVSGIIWSYVQAGPYCSLSGCTFTGPITATIFNATESPYYEINGVQISSSALSDAANIAYINAANTFTGSPQTAPVFNATSQFNVAGSQIASANLADGSNLAKINASNFFTGAINYFNATQGTIVNATTGFLANGSAGTSGQVLCSDGTYLDTLCTVYSSSNPPPAPFAGTGIPYATSTTDSTVATSAQLVTALNNSPSSILATALLPVATGSAFGTVKPDGTTITVTSGVISAVTPTIFGTPHSVSNTFGTAYPNNHGRDIFVTGYATDNDGGSTDNFMDCEVSSDGVSYTKIWSTTFGSTVSGRDEAFNCPVSEGYYYKIDASSSGSPSTPAVGGWYEWY